MQRVVPPLILVALSALLMASCSRESSTVKPDDKIRLLVGTWILKSRIVEGSEVPAQERLMKITLNEDGTFRYLYRGDQSQPWILAGQGAFSFNPPDLRFYWDDGPMENLLVVEREPDRIRVHHGFNLVPLKNEDPDEVFARVGSDKAVSKEQS
jgi:hypothetical protein